MAVTPPADRGAAREEDSRSRRFFARVARAGGMVDRHRPNLARDDARATARREPRARRPTPTRPTEAPPAARARGLAAALALGLGLFGLACQPSIGDSCVLSTDCSQRGDRLCDTSQSGGYCTVFNCVGDGCPDEASCVVFGGRVPGCLYTDRSIARTARSFCMRACELDKDCRDGYVCRDPRQPSLQGIVLDTDQSRRVCVPREADAVTSTAPSAVAPVCSAAAPSTDAGSPDTAPPPDATPPDAAPADGGARDAAVADSATDAPDGGG